MRLRYGDANGLNSLEILYMFKMNLLKRRNSVQEYVTPKFVTLAVPFRTVLNCTDLYRTLQLFFCSVRFNWITVYRTVSFSIVFRKARSQPLEAVNTVVRPNLSPCPYRTVTYRTVSGPTISAIWTFKTRHRSLKPYRFLKKSVYRTVAKKHLFPFLFLTASRTEPNSLPCSVCWR